MTKLLFSIAILFFGFNAFSQKAWTDLELNQTYELKFNVPVDEKISLEKGQAFRLDYFESGQYVFYYSFKNLSCTDGSLTSEMALFHGIGIELEFGCYVGVYIEPKNYDDDSIF